MNRVVVTGLGVVAPNANCLQDFELALRKGRSGLRHHPAMEEAGFREAAPIAAGRDERWRTVPNRKWYHRIDATRGSARELLLFHRPEETISGHPIGTQSGGDGAPAKRADDGDDHGP